jgi:hypothetical protein
MVVLVAIVPLALADAYDDLVKVHTAFQNAKSWHADENFSNGKVVTVDYVAPDHWRIQPNPKMTELIIGNDVYMVQKGRATKLPFGGGMVRKSLEQVNLNFSDEIKQSARDLGTQTLDGQSVHVYSYTVQGNPVTLYVGANSLPVQDVVQNKNLTTTIKYSQYNAPISIQAP